MARDFVEDGNKQLEEVRACARAWLWLCEGNMRACVVLTGCFPSLTRVAGARIPEEQVFISFLARFSNGARASPALPSQLASFCSRKKIFIIACIVAIIIGVIIGVYYVTK
jgi:hypothetical protein